MNDPFFAARDRDITCAIIGFPDRRITWAGEGIQPESFLLGTDRGILLECGIYGPLENTRPVQICKEPESINGVAHLFHEDELHVAATSRAEIAAHRFLPGQPVGMSFRVDYGAHGIKPTTNPGFIAAAGPSGLVALNVDANGHYIPREWPSEALTNLKANFYDIAPLGPEADTGHDVYVAACRTSGLIYFKILRDGPALPFKASVVTSRVNDFVSVLSIGTTASPLAFVALGKNRDLHFIRDPLGSRAMETLHLPQVPGTAYKILSHKTHLLMLTSKGFCVIPNVLREYQRGGFIGGYREVTYMDTDAIDFNIAYDRWLLIVTPGGVVRMDLEMLLPQRTPVDIPESIRRRINPAFPWTENSELEEIEQPSWREANLTADVVTC